MKRFLSYLTAMISLVFFGQTFGSSMIINPAADNVRVRDVLTNMSIAGGYTVADGQVHAWANDYYYGNAGYQIGNIETDVVTTVGKPSFSFNSNGYGDPFGIYDSQNNVFYAGTYSWSDSGMLKYDGNSGQWSSLGTFDSLYGADIYNGEVYASGLNQIWNGGTGQDNQIALYDLTGGSSHDVLIQATGNSAFAALDRNGNVYYANYNGTDPMLYRWTKSQVDGVRADLGNGTTGGGEGDLYLTYADATILTALPSGANGIAVDDAGNVFVTVNGSVSELLCWNNSLGMGTSDNYQILASAAGMYGWLGCIDTVGDVFNGGALYVSSYGMPGLAEVTVIPEPATLALLAVGGLLTRIRTIRNKNRRG